jgi:hypothetical protein
MDTKKQNDVNATESLGVTERRVVLNLSQDQAEKLLQWLNYSDTRHVIASDDVTETIDKIRSRISKTLTKHQNALGKALSEKMGVTGPDGN